MYQDAYTNNVDFFSLVTFFLTFRHGGYVNVNKHYWYWDEASYQDIISEVKRDPPRVNTCVLLCMFSKTLYVYVKHLKRNKYTVFLNIYLAGWQNLTDLKLWVSET